MRCDGWTRAVRAFVFARLLRGEHGFAGGGADFVAHLHQRVVRVHLHVRTRRAPAVERAPFARDDAGHDRDLRVARGGDGVGGNWEDDFGFDAGFEFDVSDDERPGPAQAAWDFSDAKDEMARELRAANATSVDQKIRNALKSGGGGKNYIFRISISVTWTLMATATSNFGSGPQSN